MKETFNLIKDGAIFVLLIFFLYQWACSKNFGNSSSAGSHSDTVTIVKTDSTVIHHVQEVGSRQGPIPVSVPVYVTIPPTNGQPGRVDTVFRNLDSLEIVKAFFTHHYYADTAHFEYGDVYVKNKTYMDLLDSQQITASFRIPQITKTVSRGQVYIGFDLLGSPANIINGIDGNLAYKTRGSKMFEVGVEKVGGLPGVLYKGGFKMLLTFKKK